MRMNVAQLKAHLSRVLREMRESGEEVEVCVREEPVAYLTSVSKRMPPPEHTDLQERVSAVGLRVTLPAQPEDPVQLPQARLAGDGQKDVSTTDRMRGEKPW